MLYSPINYQGNKSRICENIVKLIPQNIDCIHEIFCGSAIVSLVSNISKVYLNDKDVHILELLKYFQDNSAEDIIKRADNIIKNYGLTNTFYEGRSAYPEKKHEGLSIFNRDPYNKLKNDYNKDKDINKLFVLLIFGFNHYLRFNSKGEFNVPVGKTDFVELLRKRTKDYSLAIQSKLIEITNLDFRDSSLYKDMGINDLYYFDPPYLITSAPYNNFWSEKDELDLLHILDTLNMNGQKFMLSNVIESNGKENKILKEWMKKYNVHYIKRQYLNSSYHKKNLSDAIEVVITNYKGETMSDIDNKIGTSGDRVGYKVFSINTTVRNPKRNADFLNHFQEFDGKEFTPELSEQYFFKLIKYGVYRLSDIPESVKRKMENGEELTSIEVHEAIKNNPQATGLHGRVMTQLRAMKDQGFLMFQPVKRGLNKIYITQLGRDLISGNEDPTVVYTKAMLGMHAYSPIRKKILNKSRPFLNALFVIDGVNKKWKELGNEPKGLLKHEFATFVLSMKDCNYESAIENIIKYRLKYRYEPNYNVLKEFLVDNDILPIKPASLLNDYPDDVFRKFEMTGLIVKRGAFNYIYYDFSNYNIEKINTILAVYKNYKFVNFNNVKEYYEYLASIEIPWCKNEKIRSKIVESKSEILKIKLNDELTLEQKEEILDRMFYNQALENVIKETKVEFIINELKILSGASKESSKINDISEPLRLEYLLALLLGKKYGVKGLVSNIIYNEDGKPLHYAPSKKCDILYHHEDGSYILEPTMQRGKNQVLNNETTNVVRHMKEEAKQGIVFRLAMIAPYVHSDVVDYFQYKSDKEKCCLLPLNIDYITKLILDNDTIRNLNIEFDKIKDILLSLKVDEFADLINKYSLN